MRSLLIKVKQETLHDPFASVSDTLLDKIVKRYDVNGDGKIDRTRCSRQ